MLTGSRLLSFNIFIVFFLISLKIYGQDIVLKQDVNVENFPDIKFTVNIFNPETKSKEAFKLLENGHEVEFEIKAETPPVTDEEKVVLILFEDMMHKDHAFQRKVFKKILKQTLPNTVKEGDLFNIATFDRNRDGSTPLRFLNDDFTSDYQLLIDELESYNKPVDRFNNQKSSDLYNAINDGLLYLNKNFKGKNKILVVLSAGKNLEISNYNSLSDLILLARKFKIPVYSIQYMIYEHENIDALAVNTYGKFFHVQGSYKLNGDHSPGTAANSLTNFLNDALQRLQGKDYTFTYTSTFERDGKLHSVTVKTDEESENISFKAPACDIKCWFNKNKKLSYIILGSFLFLSIVLILLIRNNRKRKKEILELKEKVFLEKLKKQEEELAIQKQKAAELEFKTIEAQKKIEQEKLKKLQEEQERKKAEELKRIIKEMKAVNGFSKLRVVLPDGKSFDWSIEKPVITVGRSADNDLQINDPTVSSHHFKITYENHNYYIEDLNSSNGIIINGKRIQKTILHNNTALQVGKVKILFIK